VATDLPAMRWLGTELVAIASGPGAFAAAVDRALDVPLTPELVAERRALACSHSWSSRTEDFATALGFDVLHPRAHEVTPTWR
jgi:teichuronic acid biosynthesis glycosyltransferase TuaH